MEQVDDQEIIPLCDRNDIGGLPRIVIIEDNVVCQRGGEILLQPLNDLVLD